ncbi:MAG: DUF1643 domain-containing protein [Anaerolineae bacterium]
MSNPLERGAVFDPSGAYRYRLWRIWADGPTATFVMLNPSTADAEQDDPTIRRCIGLARSWGYGRLEVVNLFAYRTPSPDVLRLARDPVGSANDHHIRGAVGEAALVVAAWGNDGTLLGRDRETQALLASRPLHCLGVTLRGQPRHPLYVRGDTVPRLWNATQLSDATPSAGPRREGRRLAQSSGLA